MFNALVFLCCMVFCDFLYFFVEYILCCNHRQLDLVCGRVSEFSDFSKEIRALPGALTATDTAGEIRKGLLE